MDFDRNCHFSKEVVIFVDHEIFVRKECSSRILTSYAVCAVESADEEDRVEDCTEKPYSAIILYL